MMKAFLNFKFFNITVLLIGALLVGTVVLLTPSLSFLWLSICILLAILKVLALTAGVHWIFAKGEDSVPHFQERESPLTEESTKSDRNDVVYQVLATSDIRYAPFGVMDWKWFKKIDLWIHDSNKACRFKGIILKLLRTIFFRFEAQIILGAITLTLIPYSRDGVISTFTEFLSCVLVIFIFLEIVLMGIEILFGNTLMQMNYSRYFHLGLSRKPYDPTHGKVLLREIWHFSKLVFHTLIGISVICFTYYSCRGGFKCIETSMAPGRIPIDELEPRLHLFIEFFSFATTTFSTIGYGDVHPTGITSRLFMAVIHLLSISFILFLLQILLAYHVHSDPIKNDSANSSSPNGGE